MPYVSGAIHSNSKKSVMEPGFHGVLHHDVCPVQDICAALDSFELYAWTLGSACSGPWPAFSAACTRKIEGSGTPSEANTYWLGVIADPMWRSWRRRTASGARIDVLRANAATRWLMGLEPLFDRWQGIYEALSDDETGSEGVVVVAIVGDVVGGDSGCGSLSQTSHRVTRRAITIIELID